MKKHSLLYAAAAVLFVSIASGCMLTPTDGQVVANTTSPIAFGGFHLLGNTNVTVSARNPQTGVFQPIATANTGAAPYTHSADGGDLYHWGTPAIAIPNDYWEPGYRGYRAIVRATDPDRTLMSVEEDWFECWSDNGQIPAEFQANCSSPNSPNAIIRTQNYCAQRATLKVESFQHINIAAHDGYRWGRMYVTLLSDYPIIPSGNTTYAGSMQTRPWVNPGEHEALFGCDISGTPVAAGNLTRTKLLCEQMIGKDKVSGAYEFLTDCEYMRWLNAGGTLYFNPFNDIGLGTTCRENIEPTFRAMIPASSVPSSCTAPPTTMHAWATLTSQCNCVAELAYTGPGGTPNPRPVARTGNTCARDDENRNVVATNRCSAEVNKIISTVDGPYDDLRITSCTLSSYAVANATQCIPGD